MPGFLDGGWYHLFYIGDYYVLPFPYVVVSVWALCGLVLEKQIGGN